MTDTKREWVIFLPRLSINQAVLEIPKQEKILELDVQYQTGKKCV